MANPQVEKIKALVMRHGEKALVVLAGTVCLGLLGFAASKKSIPLTYDQMRQHATAAQSNLNRVQPAEEVLKKFEEEWLKQPGFEKLVDNQAQNALKGDDYKPARPWVSLEPGAGLIRDTPALVAPFELVAYPGRGGAAVFELDEDGKRIPEDPDTQKTDPTVEARRSRKRGRGRGGPGGMGGMGGMMGGRGGMGGMMGGAPGGFPNDDPEAKKAADRLEKQRKRLLAGADNPAEDEAEKEKAKAKAEAQLAENGPWKEITKGLRWVAITGKLDNKKMRDNYLAALKYTGAAPHYKQLDIERKTKLSDETWSDWEAVDIEKNREVLFHLPEEEEELTPPEVRIDSLVDPLPFLKAGIWEKVHVVSLVPKAIKDPVDAESQMGGMMGAMGGKGAMGGRGGMGAMGGRGGMGAMGGRGGMGMAGAMGGMGATGPTGGMGAMGGRGMGMMGGRGGKGGMGDMEGGMGSGMGGMGGGGDIANYPKTEAKNIMIRALDLTVEPDASYRFRVRVVVFNPNYGREDVNPGVDTKSLELRGPWSEATDEVTMPADITTYAIAKTKAGSAVRRQDQVEFQVTRWDPKDGVTVVKTFPAGPGQLVGEPQSAQIPTSEGTGVTNKQIDFNSRQVVVDSKGGPSPVITVGINGGPLNVPALSLLLRPDGSVVVRKQMFDFQDTVRKDMADIYAQELKDSSTQRTSSNRGMMGGMMGGKGGGGGGMTGF